MQQILILFNLQAPFCYPSLGKADPGDLVSLALGGIAASVDTFTG